MLLKTLAYALASAATLVNAADIDSGSLLAFAQYNPSQVSELGINTVQFYYTIAKVSDGPYELAQSASYGRSADSSLSLCYLRTRSDIANGQVEVNMEIDNAIQPEGYDGSTCTFDEDSKVASCKKVVPVNQGEFHSVMMAKEGDDIVIYLLDQDDNRFEFMVLPDYGEDLLFATSASSIQEVSTYEDINGCVPGFYQDLKAVRIKPYDDPLFDDLEFTPSTGFHRGEVNGRDGFVEFDGCSPLPTTSATVPVTTITTTSSAEPTTITTTEADVTTITTTSSAEPTTITTTEADVTTITSTEETTFTSTESAEVTTITSTQTPPVSTMTTTGSDVTSTITETGTGTVITFTNSGTAETTTITRSNGIHTITETDTSGKVTTITHSGTDVTATTTKTLTDSSGKVTTITNPGTEVTATTTKTLTGGESTDDCSDTTTKTHHNVPCSTVTVTSKGKAITKTFTKPCSESTKKHKAVPNSSDCFTGVPAPQPTCTECEEEHVKSEKHGGIKSDQPAKQSGSKGGETEPDAQPTEKKGAPEQVDGDLAAPIPQVNTGALSTVSFTLVALAALIFPAF